MLATWNLQRKCFKSVSCLFRNPSRAMDPRRFAPPRVGGACWNRERARHRLQFLMEGLIDHDKAANQRVFFDKLDRLRNVNDDLHFESDEELLKKHKQAYEALAKLLEAESNPDSHSVLLEPQLCEVCMKVVNHQSDCCPFLDFIPEPENTTVGEGYIILCDCCHKSDHGHPDGSWTGYAFSETMDDTCYYEEILLV